MNTIAKDHDEPRGRGWRPVLVAGLMMLMAAGATAATFVTDGSGLVTGVHRLEAGGQLYDLTFTGFGQTYGTVFPTGIQVPDQNEAYFIVSALTQLFNGPAVVSGIPTGQPPTIAQADLAGRPGTLPTGMYLPYLEQPEGVYPVIAQTLGWSPFSDTWVHNGSGLPYDWRDFSEGWIQVAPVPLPASAPLLGGLVGLLAAWQRRRQRGA
ncbi:MAG: hypothetical protein AB7Q81_10150 [Gammaproteobacteria bacterium]